jgi:Tfp pilus assembly protein PilV
VRPSGATCQGFTLIEIMITVLIVLAALAGIMMMALGSTKASVDSMNFNRATAYGEELLEQMREQDYANIEAQANAVSGAGCAAAGNPSWDVAADNASQTDEDSPTNPTDITFARVVSVECLGGSTLKRVTVEVKWDDEVSKRRGSQHSVKFETFRTPDPL